MKNFSTNLKLRLLWLLLTIPIFAFAQVKFSIKGKVADAQGEPLIGATVQIEQTSVGTVTNIDGMYDLSGTVPEGDYNLLISYVGYGTKTQPLTISAQNSNLTSDVILSADALNLDEVVVVGSTLKQSRRELGNAISSVSAEQLSKSGTNNLVGSLQGKVPGAQITQNSGDPAGGITVRLRGIKSIQGNSDPLYIIDGVVVSNSSANVSQTALSDQVGSAAVIGTNRLADINPADIETINVLNGAAAAAIYGSRASNGVVIITTKKGKSGAPKITLNTSLSTSSLRKKVPISTYPKQFGFAGLRLHTIGGVSAAQIAANPGTTTVGIVREGATTQLASNLVDVTRYDYQDDIFRTAIGTDNSLSISGGNDKTSYYVSLSYAKNEGIIKNTDFGRYGLRARVEQRFNDWIKMSVGLSYTNSLSNEKANGNVFYSPINSINITNNIYNLNDRDATGNLKAVEPTRVNPLTTIEAMRFQQRVNRTINDLQINLTPFKNFAIDWVVGVDAFNQLGTNYIPIYPYQAEAGLPLERYPNGFASNVNSVNLLLNSDLNATYRLKIANDLNLTTVVGANYQYQRGDFSRASGQNLGPFIETVSGASVIATGYGVTQFNLSGIFGQATLGYKGLLYLTGAVRQDRSSIFSESQTNQVYPKFSASFIPSDMEVWRTSKIAKGLSGLKLRFSWGQSGNLTGLGVYDRFWQFNPAPFLGKNATIPNSALANPSVSPERMTETEGGADFSFLENRMNLGVTVYQQKISELVVNRVVASSSGGTSIVNNVGEMENKGVEVALSVVPVKTKDLTWDVTFMFNRNRNKITKLGSPTVTLSNVAGAPSFLLEGYAASVFYGNPYARDASGNLLLTAQQLPQRERGVQTGLTTFTPGRTDGQPSGTFIRTIIGDPNPDWTGSLASSLTFKGFSFKFLLDAVQGVDVFNADKRTRNNVGIGDIAEQEMKGEVARGTVFALVPIEEYRVDNGSFVKLREIGLSYAFKTSFKGLSAITLGLTGRNLISWDKYNGFDPETNAGGNSDLLRGVDFGNVPIPRSFQMQLTANF